MFNKRHIVYNGNFIPEENFTLSLNNRAFLYNDSVFETIFSLSHKVLFLDKHIERLISGMNALEMSVPKNFTVNKFENEILKLLLKNKIFGSARIRLKIYRKEGGLFTPENNYTEYIITAKKLKEKKFILNEAGLKLGEFTKIRKNKTLFSNFKSQNSFLSILAGKYAKKNSLDDCIIFNDENRICETVSSNIFIVKGGKILTPALSEACVAGIMRKVVIKTAKESGILVKETSLKKEDLLQSEEVFLTNSISGIRWVIAYKEKRYFNKTAKKLIEIINEKYIK